MPEFQLPLSYDDTLVLLREVIAEKGVGYVDEGDCKYVRDGEPSCGVGHVLHRAGMPLETLARIDLVRDSDVASVPVFRKWLEPAALRLLKHFQEDQDAGRAWGVALVDAIELAEDSDG